MLKRLYCQCEVGLELQCEDPILVKSGYESPDGVKMAFITTNRSGEPEAFLPGSSLKGVFRSHFEKICRTLRPDPSVVCLPYREYKQEEPEVFCGAMFQAKRDRLNKKKSEQKKRLSNREVYRHSCPACRMFGSTYFIGRFATTDAYQVNPRLPEVRPGVAIDRHCGKVAQGPFDYEALNGAVFTTRIFLRNFELWMLGALGYLLWDLQDEIIRIGAHKSRGMGRVRGKITDISLAYYLDPEGQVKGLDDFVSEKEREDYGMHHLPTPRPVLSVPAVPRGIRLVYDVTPLATVTAASGPILRSDGLFAQVAGMFNEYIRDCRWPEPIVAYTGAT